MTVRKGATRPGSSRQIRGERMKDEVYRQMFLLEESRPGAELGLALALLRAWLFADQKPAGDEGRRMAQEGISDLSEDDRSRIAGCRHCSSQDAMSALQSGMSCEQEPPEGRLKGTHAGIY